MGVIVAIDGPAGSGKGTATKLVAEKLDLVNIDTGAMYRCVTLECLENKVKTTDIDSIKNILKDIAIELKKEKNSNENYTQKVYLNKNDVTEKIRTPEIDSFVAKFAAIKEVRETMVFMQRKMGENANIIMEGRDIGTTVFPNADIKIYLDASIEERASRRYKQNIEKGIKCDYDEILASIKERHILETTREISPLVQAVDAIYIDSSKINIEQVVEKIINIIREKKGNI